MTSLYVDIGRLRIAALEIVERRLALRIIENVFDLSLERLAFDCSYGEQPTICGRSRAPRETLARSVCQGLLLRQPRPAPAWSKLGPRDVASIRIWSWTSTIQVLARRAFAMIPISEVFAGVSNKISKL